MDEETRLQMFEPRFSTRARGSGLGLSMVSNVVTQCGGAVAASSTEGQGTQVRVTLPVV
jgi:signal transduction histidine kinase